MERQERIGTELFSLLPERAWLNRFPQDSKRNLEKGRLVARGSRNAAASVSPLDGSPLAEIRGHGPAGNRGCVAIDTGLQEAGLSQPLEQGDVLLPLSVNGNGGG